MKKRVIIMGGSGIGMIAVSIIDRHPELEFIGFLNDIIEKGSMIGKYNKYEVLGNSEEVHNYIIEEDVYVFLAYIGMTHKQETYNKMLKINIPMDKFINIIDPSAIIPHSLCKIGRGVMLAPLSQLSSDTTIGDNCILLPNSFVGHDTTLESYTSLATNSVVGANVHIGKAVHIGSNATIREKVMIGDYSLIGMGAVVIKDVPPNSIVVGNPAHVLKSSENTGKEK